MKFPWGRKEIEGVGAVIDESEAQKKTNEQYIPLSPQVKSQTTAPVSDQISDMERPDVPFLQCYDYLTSVPELQSVVQGEIDNIISRDWYYAPIESDDTEKTEKSSKVKEYVKECNRWEVQYELERIFEYLVADWSVCGNNLIDISVWKPVQFGRIEGLNRNE